MAVCLFPRGVQKRATDWTPRTSVTACPREFPHLHIWGKKDVNLRSLGIIGFTVYRDTRIGQGHTSHDLYRCERIG